MTIVEPIRDINKINQIKEILKNKNLRDYLIFIMGINSGLRISDILNLKVADVIDKNYIQIIEQKTKKSKKFPISKTYQQELNIFIKNKNPKEALFSGKNKNKSISRIQAYRIITSACKKANIKVNIGTHTLRKTFGYHFYKKTKDIALLQTILNHSSPKITLRYIGINQEIIDLSLKSFDL